MQTILFFIVVFLTNILQVITGFAGTMLAMPASMGLVGVETATASLNIVGLVLSLIIVVREREHINKVELTNIVKYMFVGLVLGLLIYNIVQIDLLLKVYGVVIVIIAISKLTRTEPKVYSKKTLITILIVAGIIHGMFVSGGAFLVVYASVQLCDKDEFRATMSSVWVVLNSILFLVHLYMGYFDRRTIILTSFAVVTALGSVFVGNIIFNRINLNVFLLITYILLLCSGILLIF